MLLNNRVFIRWGWLVFLAVSAVSAVAEVRLELEETEITGARELPKVLYIVPWKKTGPDSRPLPMKSLMDEVLAPIDIDVFRRQVRYYEFTHEAPEQEAAPQ
ncbi:MAG: hypothetical protein L3J84_10175 [Gammaproteobacteria bacterium]|nr:hypothetical protein [Gammaproteobacteria bacterium]